ncbi:MAG: hypothetical protein ACLTG0_09215 [Oscillibacter sp.]
MLDKTRRPWVARLLRSWLERPLLSVTAIAKRTCMPWLPWWRAPWRGRSCIAALTGLGDMGAAHRPHRLRHRRGRDMVYPPRRHRAAALPSGPSCRGIFRRTAGGAGRRSWPT